MILVIRRIQKIRHRTLRSECGAGCGYGTILVGSIGAGSGAGSFDENLPDPGTDLNGQQESQAEPDPDHNAQRRSQSRIFILYLYSKRFNIERD